jgi:hypothetical protein
VTTSASTGSFSSFVFDIEFACPIFWSWSPLHITVRHEMKSRKVIALVMLHISVATSMGVVVGTVHMSDDIIEDPNTFTIYQDFASTDLTGFFFSSLGGNSYSYAGSYLDEGASLFFVNANDEFSELNILGGAFTQLSSVPVYNFSQSFFLGIRTPTVGFDVDRFPPAYGWAEFQSTGTGELLLVDHAVAYGGQGIFVDTVTPIPEPGSLTLGSVALSLLFKRRRRRTRRGRASSSRQ